MDTIVEHQLLYEVQEYEANQQGLYENMNTHVYVAMGQRTSIMTQ
jgi:hypothetical protein